MMAHRANQSNDGDGQKKDSRRHDATQDWQTVDHGRVLSIGGHANQQKRDQYVAHIQTDQGAPRTLKRPLGPHDGSQTTKQKMIVRSKRESSEDEERGALFPLEFDLLPLSFVSCFS